MVETVKVTGLKELDKALRRLDIATGKKVMREALRRAATPIAREMRQAAPVGTGGSRMVTTSKGSKVEHRPGFLKSRIRVRSRFNNRGATKGRQFSGNQVVRVKVGVFSVPYVAAIECGTRKQAPQRFIRPAFYNNWRQSVDIYKDQLGKKIAKAAKR